MKTLKLSNPIIKSDSLDDTFTGGSQLEVAKNAFRTIAKYILTKDKAKFLFTLKDVTTGKEYHFQGDKSINTSENKKKAKLRVQKISVKKNNKDQTVDLAGGKKRKGSRKSKSSSGSDDENISLYMKRRHIYPPNTYFFYDPLLYYNPVYTSYIFDRRLFLPNLYYSLYPYNNQVSAWGW
jgi:hypothetical protein